jgi:hypothetical protein
MDFDEIWYKLSLHSNPGLSLLISYSQLYRYDERVSSVYVKVTENKLRDIICEEAAMLIICLKTHFYFLF